MIPTSLNSAEGADDLLYGATLASACAQATDRRSEVTVGWVLCHTTADTVRYVVGLTMPDITRLK
jgi:hypothetical protein